MRRAILILVFLSACSSPGGDAAPEDTRAAHDARGDAASDAPADAAADFVVPTDLPPDRSPAPADTVDWEVLPPLPPDKTFTTRYAAGAALRSIDPPDPVGRHMAGFGFCMFAPSDCKYSEGLHDPLTVQAASIADTETGVVVIFVGVDTVGLFRCDIDAIHDAVPAAFAMRHGVALPGVRVVVAASHTHSAPDTAGLWGPMLGAERDEEAYIAQVRDAVVEAALDAYGDLGDATLVRGVGTAPNHDDDLQHDDEDVHVLRARRPDGTPVFHLTRWTAHPTVYWDGQNGLSADFVGAYRNRIHETAGGVAVYLNGPIGSVYADGVEGCAQGDLFPEGYQDPDLGPGDHGKVACIGANLADAALAALEDGSPLAETGIRFRHAEFGFRPDNVLLATVIKEGPVPMEVPDLSDPDALWFSAFSWITVGDLELLTTPGESFPSFAHAAKQRLAEATEGSPVILGLAQDYLGYLMTEAQYHEEHLDYYRSLSPGPAVESAYMAALDALIAAE